jgi:predicted HAD superfamily Cof-like phosphohydrolase
MASRKKKKPATALVSERASNAESLGSGLKLKDSAARAAPQVASKERACQRSQLKRTRRTETLHQAERRDQQIIEAVEHDHPQLVRHVLYMMLLCDANEALWPDIARDLAGKLERRGPS